MRPCLFFVFAFSILALSCNSAKTTNEIFKAANLHAQHFTIAADRDTTLHTENGALIQIGKDAISSTKKNITLEVKEAYTIYDMVVANLTTRLNGNALSSGGMIYINPVDDPAAKIVKPISISLPTKFYRKDMSLFKGDTAANGQINWSSPTPITPAPQNSRLAKGAALFQSNCTSCHTITKDATGPALAYITERRDWDWLKRFTRNSSELIASGDCFANSLCNHWGHTQMTAFNLNDSDIAALYAYIENESQKYPRSAFPDYKKSFDSCVSYHHLANELNEKQSKLLKDNTANLKDDSRTVVNKHRDTASLKTIIKLPDNYIMPFQAPAEYYQFTINTFGWYNVDIFFKDIPEFKNSTLKVQLTGDYQDNVFIYLVIPSQKLLLDGGLMAGSNNTYAFYTNDGSIPLPQNTPAFVFAFNDNKGKIMFDLKEFTTSLDQTISLNLITTDKDAMLARIKSFSLDGFEMGINKTKNADSIRVIDQKLDSLEKFKPKIANCDCGGADSIYVKTDER